MGSLFAGTSKCPGVARTVVKGSVYKRGTTCLNLRPCKSYACYGHTILGYEKSCAGAPQHKSKGKVRWLQKDACSFLTSCSRVVHGSGVSRFVCRGVRSCTGPKLVATRALPLSLCSLCPCSLCPLVHLDGGPHHLLCESPSLVVGAPLCARWCRRFCRPCGSWHPHSSR